MQRQAPSDGSGDDAAAAFRQQQQRAQLQQLQQQMAASNGGGGGLFNYSSLWAQQQQEAAAMALVSDVRAAALAAQLRQAAQSQHLNHHHLLSQQDQLLLAMMAGQSQQHQPGMGVGGGRGVLDDHQQLLGLQQRQHHHGFQDLELRLLQQQQEERQRLQQQRSAGGSPAQHSQQQHQAKEAQNRFSQEQLEQIQILHKRHTTEQNARAAFDEERKLFLAQAERRLAAESVASTQTQQQHQTRPSSAFSSSEGPRDVESSLGLAKIMANKPPGAIMVPCRARGMPMDHNFKTAYFIIPRNIKHGDELKCSYYACHNSGIKFRYCTHCKIPVAKRNFRKRHNHGMSPSLITGSDDESVGDHDDAYDSESMLTTPSAAVSAKKSAPPSPVDPPPLPQSSVATLASVAAKVSKAPVSNKPLLSSFSVDSKVISSSNSSSKRTIPNAASEPHLKVSHENTCTHEAPPQIAPIDNHTPSTDQQNNGEDVNCDQNGRTPAARVQDQNVDIVKAVVKQIDTDFKFDDKRAERWAGLLWERPPTGDSNAMSSWLLEVLAVSDLEKPLKNEDAPPLPQSSSTQHREMEEKAGNIEQCPVSRKKETNSRPNGTKLIKKRKPASGADGLAKEIKRDKPCADGDSKGDGYDPRKKSKGFR